MANIGGSGQARDEEPRDIHTVWEQIVPREPSPLITVEGAEYEPETDPEEESEEEEEDPEEIPISSLGAQMYDVVYDRNIELQDKVEELEEIAAERQTALDESRAKVQDLTACVADLREQLAQSEHLRGQVVAEKEIMRDDLREESVKRVRADRRVDCVEAEVQSKKAKIDEMDYAFHTAVDRAKDRVLQYPVQFEDLPWYMMDRRTMVRILEQEREDAVRRGML